MLQQLRKTAIIDSPPTELEESESETVQSNDQLEQGDQQIS